MMIVNESFSNKYCRCDMNVREVCFTIKHSKGIKISRKGSRRQNEKRRQKTKTREKNSKCLLEGYNIPLNKTRRLSTKSIQQIGTNKGTEI